MKINPSTLALVAGSLALGAACFAGASTAKAATLRALGTDASLGPVSNPYPFVQGDTFQYAHRASHSETPAGQPFVQDKTTGTLAVTIGGTVAFDGHRLTDVNRVLTYATTSNQNVTTTGTTTTDDYETFASTHGGLNFNEYGYLDAGNYSNSEGTSGTNSDLLTYGAAYLLDKIPEVRGAAWTDEIAYAESSQSTSTNSGVTSSTQTNYTRDESGGYTRSLTRSKPGTATYTETDTQHADGSGEDQNNGTGSTGGTTSFSAPASSDGKYVITVVYTPPSGSPTTTVVPDWFPGNGPAGKLVTDERKDEGTVTVPAECGASAGQKAVVIREVLTALDVVQGTYNTESNDSFVVAGEGKVCDIQKRLLNTYANRTTGLLQVSERFNQVNALTGESLQALKARNLVIGF